MYDMMRLQALAEKRVEVELEVVERTQEIIEELSNVKLYGVLSEDELDLQTRARAEHDIEMKSIMARLNYIDQAIKETQGET